MAHKKPKDIGLKRAPGGNTPGILDQFVFGQDDVGSTEGNFLTEALLSALGIGSEIRFGMTGDEKVQRQGAGFFPGGTPGQSPSIGDADQAQRALSVASAADRFGPEIPLLLSLLSVDNPAVSNPESAQATRDAFSSLQSGEFTPGPLTGAGPGVLGAPGGGTFSGALAGATAAPLPFLLSQVAQGPRLEFAQMLLDKFGAQPDVEGPLALKEQRPAETGARPLDALGGALAKLFGMQ